MTAMPTDPRDVELEQIGTRLRDGAVTPRGDDFLGPTNAGAEGDLGNPHGPHVVNPEIHATSWIRPGLVSDDPETQSEQETEFLAERQPQVAPTPDDPDEGD